MEKRHKLLPKITNTYKKEFDCHKEKEQEYWESLTPEVQMHRTSLRLRLGQNQKEAFFSQYKPSMV